MKKSLARTVCTALFLIAVLFMFLMSGCVQKLEAGPDNASEVSDISDLPNLPDDELLDCDWTIYVDQTIPVNTDGMTVEYTLVLIAQKAGGTDVNGTYEGAAYIGCKLDASSLSNEVIQVFGGFDMNAYANSVSFDVVPYDINTYTSYQVPEGSVGIPPLVEYESMALLSPEMTGGGVLNPSVFGIQGEHMEYNDTAYGTEAITMKVAIQSGKVTVTVPSFNIGYSFEGTVLGDPEPGQYQQGVERIEELIAEAEEAEEEGIGGMEGLGDLIGQFIGG